MSDLDGSQDRATSLRGCHRVKVVGLQDVSSSLPAQGKAAARWAGRRQWAGSSRPGARQLQRPGWGPVCVSACVRHRAVIMLQLAY